MRIRRAPIVLTATVAGVAAVLSFRAREPGLLDLPPGCPGAVTTDGRTLATGVEMKSKYGITQVKVTIEGEKITAVKALSLPDHKSRSVQIGEFVVPVLQKRMLTEQTADVDAISGATYTATSYKASLQSALDEADFEGAGRAETRVPGTATPKAPPEKCDLSAEES